MEFVDDVGLPDVQQGRANVRTFWNDVAKKIIQGYKKAGYLDMAPDERPWAVLYHAGEPGEWTQKPLLGHEAVWNGVASRHRFKDEARSPDSVRSAFLLHVGRQYRDKDGNDMPFVVVRRLKVLYVRYTGD